MLNLSRQNVYTAMRLVAGVVLGFVLFMAIASVATIVVILFTTDDISSQLREFVSYYPMSTLGVIAFGGFFSIPVFILCEVGSVCAAMILDSKARAKANAARPN